MNISTPVRRGGENAARKLFRDWMSSRYLQGDKVANLALQTLIQTPGAIAQIPTWKVWDLFYADPTQLITIWNQMSDWQRSWWVNLKHYIPLPTMLYKGWIQWFLRVGYLSQSSQGEPVRMAQLQHAMLSFHRNRFSAQWWMCVENCSIWPILLTYSTPQVVPDLVKIREATQTAISAIADTGQAGK